MGAPAGHPYAHPEGVCINGLGALPSPYGPTLRGAHNGPSGLQKIKVSGCAETLGSRLVKLRFNSGQIRCKPSQNVRLDPGLHGATTKWNRANPSWPATSTKPKIWNEGAMTENIGQISSTGGGEVSTRIAILKVTLPHKIYLDVGILSTFLVACESRVFSLMKKCYVSFTRILVSFNKQINSS